jgi:hypothetical protein
MKTAVSVAESTLEPDRPNSEAPKSLPFEHRPKFLANLMVLGSPLPAGTHQGGLLARVRDRGNDFVRHITDVAASTSGERDGNR